MNKLMMIAACAGMLALASCKSTCYQVYNVAAPEAMTSETDIKYAYDDITVSYNFWSHGGLASRSPTIRTRLSTST